MEKIKYLIYPFLIAAGLCVISCTKENDYKKFVKDGERSYPGRADTVIVQAGNKRIQLRVVLGPDPLITKIKTYWNNSADSLETPVVRTNGDTVNIILNSHLNEGTNNFEVYTYNSKGDRSVVTNATGNMYGDNYMSAVVNRKISSVLQSGAGATINWSPAITGEQRIEVNYTDETGAAQSLAVLPTQTATQIASYKLGTDISYRSVYAPEPNSFDVFSADYSKVSIFTAASTGYFYHPSSPRALSSTKTMFSSGANGVIVDLGDLGGSGYKALITVNADNTLTITAAPGAAGAPYLMFTSDLPAPYAAAWAGSPSCNNTYDPATKTYKVRYGYGSAGAYRVTEELLVRN